MYLRHCEIEFTSAPLGRNESLTDYRVRIQVSRPTEITGYQRETRSIDEHFIPSMKRLLTW